MLKPLEERNEFIRDAATLLRIARMSRNDVLQGTLFHGVGFEHLMKGILYDVNPTYIYEDPSFANTAIVLYGARVSALDEKVPKKKYEDKVIGFTDTLVRAACFSSTVVKHREKLNQVRAARDVVAHHRLSLLAAFDLPLMRETNHEMIVDFENELELPRGSLDGRGADDETELTALVEFKYGHEITAKEKARARMQLRFRTALEQWRNLGPDEAAKAEEWHHRLLDRADDATLAYLAMNCPACPNSALLKVKRDRDAAGPILTAESVWCFFCGLNMDDAFELDEIGAGDLLFRKARELDGLTR